MLRDVLGSGRCCGAEISITAAARKRGRCVDSAAVRSRFYRPQIRVRLPGSVGLLRCLSPRQSRGKRAVLDWTGCAPGTRIHVCVLLTTFDRSVAGDVTVSGAGNKAGAAGCAVATAILGMCSIRRHASGRG